MRYGLDALGVGWTLLDSGGLQGVGTSHNIRELTLAKLLVAAASLNSGIAPRPSALSVRSYDWRLIQRVPACWYVLRLLEVSEAGSHLPKKEKRPRLAIVLLAAKLVYHVG